MRTTKKLTLLLTLAVASGACLITALASGAAESEAHTTDVHAPVVSQPAPPAIGGTVTVVDAQGLLVLDPDGNPIRVRVGKLPPAPPANQGATVSASQAENPTVHVTERSVAEALIRTSEEIADGGG